MSSSGGTDDRDHAQAEGRPAPSADALREDAAASYAAAAAAPATTARERAIVSAQIGRPARGRSAIVHRCVFGLPTVVRVDPRLEDGTPFPTVFWQTCPVLRARIGRLEAEHAMVGLNQRLNDDATFAADYAASSGRYVAFRDELGGPLPGNPSAGGMPDYVKCLHVAAGHHLATGDNPVGAWVIDAVTPMSCPGPCVDENAIEERRGG